MSFEVQSFFWRCFCVVICLKPVASSIILLGTYLHALPRSFWRSFQAVSYCSKQCQIMHWKKGGHKHACTPAHAHNESSSPRAVSDIGQASKGASVQMGAIGMRPVSVVVSARAQRLKRMLSAFLAMTVLLAVTGQPLPFGLQKLVDRVSPMDSPSSPFPFAPSSMADSDAPAAAAVDGTAPGGDGECVAGTCEAGTTSGKGSKATEVKTGGPKTNGDSSSAALNSDSTTTLSPAEAKAAAKAAAKAEKAEKARLAKEQKEEAARVAAEAKQALKAQKAEEARAKKAAQEAKKAADRAAKEKAKAEKAEAARLAKEAAKEAKLAAAAAKAQQAK